MKILYLPHAYSQQRQHEKPRKIYPVRLAMEAEYYRSQGHGVIWNAYAHERYIEKVITEPENLNFLDLPPPDREFTRWWEYQDNGNFKYLPGTYTLAASGCPWGRCTFCVEKGQPYQVRDVTEVINEVIACRKMGFKEIFDDSATFPVGDWLFAFCKAIKAVDIRISCNMRFGFLRGSDYRALHAAGFRMLLWGMESANQRTLNMICKGITVTQARDELRLADRYGLENHLAVMFGYPWETDAEATHTLRFVHQALRKGWARTAQASFYAPPDKSEVNHAHRRFLPRIYEAGYYPDFWFNQLRKVRNTADIKYIWRGIREALKSRREPCKNP